MDKKETSSNTNTKNKKKKSRRPPRNKLNAVNKSEFNFSNSKIYKKKSETSSIVNNKINKLDNSISFKIEPQKDHKAFFLKKKSSNPCNINLDTFSNNKNENGIYIFQTSSTSVVKKFNKLSINETPSPSKKKKSKKLLKFNDYLSESEIENGLLMGNLFKGLIRINMKNPNEGYITNEDKSSCDYVTKTNVDRNRALEGDEVVFKLKEKQTNDDNICKPIEVVYILKQNHPRKTVGILRKMNSEYAEFVPRDKKVPYIRIPSVCCPYNFQNDAKLYEEILFLVQITDWTIVSHADGFIIENLGVRGNLNVESMAILKEFSLDVTPFNKQYDEFLKFPKELPLENREDFRKECIFTIDPSTAKDLDDAVSCKLLDNGNYEVGIHISDVSYYLSQGTDLDEVVKQKATSIYLVDTVYHMLPVLLCVQCSLLPGFDKLSYSVIYEMTKDGEIINERITRSIINSCSQLSYEHAQAIIDNKPIKDKPKIHNNYTWSHIENVVKNLNSIAVKLREKRIKGGSLRIDQIKIVFSLNPNGEPESFQIIELKLANKLIEEFMLLANQTVAKFLLKHYPDLAFLRCHESPKQYMLEELKQTLENVGIFLNIQSSGSLHNSVQKYITDDYSGHCRNVVLNHLLAKTMVRARYFCIGSKNDTDPSHYTLNIPIYTHFTSPIRRYADIIVHRLLSGALKYCDKPNYTIENIEDIAEICNIKKYSAKRAGEVSTELYLAHFIEKNKKIVEEAVIFDVKENSFDAITLSSGQPIRLFRNNFSKLVKWHSSELKTNNSNGKKLWSIHLLYSQSKNDPLKKYILELFTVIEVELTRKPNCNKLDVTLIRPKLNNS